MMNLKQYQPILSLLLFSAVTLLVHKCFLYVIGLDQLESQFVYALPRLYAFFFLLSAVILFILIKVNQASSTHVGLTFILLTTFKMGVAYIFLKPILRTNLLHSGFENFFDRFFVVFSNRNPFDDKNNKQ
jgi:uncharacterized membrane protein SirB2